MISIDLTPAIASHDEELINKCLQGLFITDPERDRERLEATKDELLNDCYRWILNDRQLQGWQHDDQCQLLWIKGEPGKGTNIYLEKLHNS